jgi:hypothetical protein
LAEDALVDQMLLPGISGDTDILKDDGRLSADALTSDAEAPTQT